MIYKRYWVNYVDFQDLIACMVSDKDIDIENFDKSNPESYNQFTNGFLINRNLYEHARGFVDANGLFMGIFPPELIEKDIIEYKEKQDKKREYYMNKVKEKYKNPLPESFFENLAMHNLELDTVYKEVQISNMMSKEYWGVEFPIEDYYMEYLLKFWRVTLNINVGRS